MVASTHAVVQELVTHEELVEIGGRDGFMYDLLILDGSFTAGPG